MCNNYGIDNNTLLIIFQYLVYIKGGRGYKLLTCYGMHELIIE